MTPEAYQHVKKVFAEALRTDPAQWAEFVATALPHDATLQRQVLTLLNEHQAQVADEQSIGAGVASLIAGEANSAVQQLEDPSNGPTHVGSTIGRYRVIREIARGGFAVVYLAEQSEPVQRQVALKVIKPGMDSQAVIARFEQERRTVAMMSHPNIASIFDGGVTPQGRPYFVMEYVRGDPITQYCDMKRLSIAHRLELFIRVCEAVQHAHAKGIIHRDLKPSNILVDLVDGVPVPKVIDFGIAKALYRPHSSAAMVTEQGQLIGTPEYMSPEQTGHSNFDIDTRSDVYSLGVLLYELLTGIRPFFGILPHYGGLADLYKIIRDVDPPSPSSRLSQLASSTGPKNSIAHLAATRQTAVRAIVSTLRHDLDWVVMKCLEKDRERRYGTAAAVAADIRRFLSDLPVEAGPPSLHYRARKFVKRNRMGVVTGLIIAAALVVTVSVSVTFGIVADRERDRAERQRLIAERLREQSQTALLAARESEFLLRLKAAKIAIRDEDYTVARQYLAAAAPTEALELHREFAAWDLARHSREVRRVDLRSALPEAVALDLLSARLDRSGTRIQITTSFEITEDLDIEQAIASTQQVFARVDPILHTDNGDGFCANVLPHQISRLSISYTSNGTQFCEMDATGASLAYSELFPVHTHILAVDVDLGLALVELPSLQLVVLRRDGERYVRALTLGRHRRPAATVFAPDGRFVYVVGQDFIYRQFTIEDRPSIRSVKAHQGGAHYSDLKGTVRHLVTEMEGEYLATLGYDHTLTVWNEPSLEPVQSMRLDSDSGLIGFRSGHAAWVKGSDLLAVATLKGPARLVHTASLTEVAQLPWPSEPPSPTSLNATRVEAHPQRPVVAVASESGVMIRDLNGSVRCWIPSPEHSFPYDMEWHPSGDLLFIVYGIEPSKDFATVQPKVVVVSIQTGEVVSQWSCHQAGLRDVDVSPDGDLIAVASRDGTASVWHWPEQSRAFEFVIEQGRAHSNIANAIKFHPVKPVVAVASNRAEIAFFSTDTGTQMGTLDLDPLRKLEYGRSGPVKDIQYSRDGRRLLVAVLDEIWSVDLHYFDEAISNILHQPAP